MVHHSNAFQETNPAICNSFSGIFIFYVTFDDLTIIKISRFYLRGGLSSIDTPESDSYDSVLTRARLKPSAELFNVLDINVVRCELAS